VKGSLAAQKDFEESDHVQTSNHLPRFFMIKEYSSSYILYNTRIASIHSHALRFVDCGTSDIFADDENIWQFTNGNLPIAGFPVFESLPVGCSHSTKFLPEISLPIFW
jgi:hypothetical protein